MIDEEDRGYPILHGTAHEQLDSLCKVCKRTDLNIINQAHSYVELLSIHSSAMPTPIAAISLNIASVQSPRGTQIQREIYRYTGCTETTKTELIRDVIFGLSLKKRELEGKKKEI